MMYLASIGFNAAVYINIFSALWYLIARVQGYNNTWLESVNEEDLSGSGVLLVGCFR
jgi:hypothetical protein